jgi:hypothetical protein
MHSKPQAVATIAGACEVDRAIAKLVLAFGTDPVARWMYDDPHQYLMHIPRLFRALGTNSFEAGAAQRTSDGLGVALWLPPGVHGDSGWLDAVIAESIAGRRRLRKDRALPADGASLVPVAHRRRSFGSEQRMWRHLTAARSSPMRPRAPPDVPLVVEPAKYFALQEARLRDRGYDPSRFVAFHLSDAAPGALKIERTTEPESEAAAVAHVGQDAVTDVTT